MDPQWDDLKCFLAVARAESLSAAGKELRLDPATVGRRIARLERDLDALLFTRSPQGYVLTAEGQRLFGHVAQAEVAMAKGAQSLAGQGERLSGQIRLGAPDGAANYLLPQVCAGIVEANPDLDVQIVALPRVFNLSRREADMAIGVSQPTAGRLRVTKLADYQLHLAASQQYLRVHGAVNDISDLKGHRMIGYIPDMIFDAELDYLSELGVERVNLASNSVSVQFNWVRQGGGLGVVHDFALPSVTGVRKVLEHQIGMTRTFYLIRHVDDARVERLNRFAALLSDGVAREVVRLERLS